MDNKALVPFRSLQESQAPDSDVPQLVGYGRVDGFEMTTTHHPLGAGPETITGMYMYVAGGNRIQTASLTMYMRSDDSHYFVSSFVVNSVWFGALGQMPDLSRYSLPDPAEIWGRFSSSDAAIKFLGMELSKRPLDTKRLKS